MWLLDLEPPPRHAAGFRRHALDAFILPLFLLGIGFALTVGSVTAVAINTVEPNYIGMASATTNLLRDLGFALGPVVGSAIAFSVGAAIFGPQIGGILSGAGLPAEAVAGLSHVPPLGFLSGWEGVVAQFSAETLASGAPQQAVDGAVAALGDSRAAIQGSAGASLGSGFQMVYLIAAIAATASAVLTLFISGKKTDLPVSDEELAETISDGVLPESASPGGLGALRRALLVCVSRAARGTAGSARPAGGRVVANRTGPCH